MSLTVRNLLDRAELQLRAIAGSPAALRGELAWALISELPDPSPYIDGGDLVLTTGSRLSQGQAARRQYVGRLKDAGAVALGFGVSAFYPEVPDDLAAAAQEADLPLLYVPAATGFSVIGRLVSDYLSDERQKELTFAVSAQRDLSRASLSPYAARAIVERLAKAVQGWALLLDHDGALRAGVPAGRTHLARVRIDLPRLRERGGASSVSMSVAGESVVLLPLTVRSSIRGFLAVGRSTPLGRAEQAIVTTAVSLLCADLNTEWGLLDSQRRHRLAVFKVATEGDVALAASIAESLDTDFPEGDLRVAVLGVPTGHEVELLEHAESDHGLRSLCALVAEWEKGRVVVLMPPAEGDVRTLESLLRRIPLARGAVSDPVSARELPQAWVQVRSVFNSAPGSAGKLAFASDVATAGLMRHLHNDEARGWAEALLAPLRDKDRTSKIDLRLTLRTFLANNGQSDASASALGIHRHTLRYRMGKVAEALERDIDDPTTRAELWIALLLDDRL
ncbi:PucR family transcriptional regulator [Pseudonocardia broussonetiae]|uniref:PucR family transcriptional regulator n=1 Tax=Pseudonocardia broussonetiae TaxID=2736640 RepID=A0A6M6JPM7_9PSEU|nr:PucR family transcriptional regulator [Pseudonocardia broussonetiae]QJY49365.1 PucR family transcriptional regulator [Pseudonocardia broussonetiae]